jgi:hypothetical protein
MSDTRPSAGSPRFAEHNLVATYSSAEQARAALQMLERKGVEASDIELFGPGIEAAGQAMTNDEMHDADVALTTAVGKRLGVGIFAGAIIGAIIGVVLGAVIGGNATAMTMGGFAGAAAGVALGFFWSGYSGLPVNEQFEETFQGPGGETSVAVHSSDPSEIETAVAALKGSDAKRLATCGPDGQLRDVA